MILDWLGTYYVDNAVIITNPAVIVSSGPQTASITETGNAVDTKEGVVTRIASITEAANAQDTKDAGFVAAAARVEAAAAADSSTAVLIRAAIQTEAASAIDTHNGIRTTTAARVEAASAQDTHNGVRVYSATQTEAGNATESVISAIKAVNAVISESGNAVDIPGAAAIYNVSIIESASATDYLSVILLLYILKYWNGIAHERGALKCYVKARGGWISPKLKTYKNGEWKLVNTDG